MRQPQASIWHSTHSLGGKLLRLPLRLIPHEMNVRVLTGVNKGARWIVGSGVHHCWIGTYECERQSAVERTLRPGMVAWDLGANVGFYTLAFSSLVESSGKVVAFEANGLNVAYLLKHVELNNRSNVTVVQAAVSGSSGLISFAAAQSSFTGAISADSAYKIPSVSLDGYLDETGSALPDLIKIDVEGAEAAVLRGAEQILRRGAPELWLALHNERQMVECTSLLKDFGYAMWNLSGEAIDQINCLEVVARKRV